MDIHTFMTNYREAFGERAELPIAFWYSDKQENETEKIGGRPYGRGRHPR